MRNDAFLVIFCSWILEQLCRFFDNGNQVSTKSGEVHLMTYRICILQAVDNVSLDFLFEMKNHELNQFFFQVDFDKGIDFVVNDF
jgi:hypothetical protein